MPAYLVMFISDCCGSPVRVEGRTTQYHVCTGCGRACDVAPRDGRGD